MIERWVFCCLHHQSKRHVTAWAANAFQTLKLPHTIRACIKEDRFITSNSAVCCRWKQKRTHLLSFFPLRGCTRMASQKKGTLPTAHGHRRWLPRPCTRTYPLGSKQWSLSNLSLHFLCSSKEQGRRSSKSPYIWDRDNTVEHTLDLHDTRQDLDLCMASINAARKRWKEREWKRKPWRWETPLIPPLFKALFFENASRASCAASKVLMAGSASLSARTRRQHLTSSLSPVSGARRACFLSHRNMTPRDGRGGGGGLPEQIL